MERLVQGVESFPHRMYSESLILKNDEAPTEIIDLTQSKNVRLLGELQLAIMVVLQISF